MLLFSIKVDWKEKKEIKDWYVIKITNVIKIQCKTLKIMKLNWIWSWQWNLNIVIIYFMPTKNQRWLERKERDQVPVCCRKKYMFYWNNILTAIFIIVANSDTCKVTLDSTSFCYTPWKSLFKGILMSSFFRTFCTVSVCLSDF